LRLAIILRVSIDVFGSLVFVQADIQWVAMLVNTVTEMLAGVRAAAVLAPVRDAAKNGEIAKPLVPL